MANNSVAIDDDFTDDDFTMIFTVKLIMFDYQRESLVCVYEQDECLVVPPSTKKRDGKVFTLKTSYEIGNKTFLIYLLSNK